MLFLWSVKNVAGWVQIFPGSIILVIYFWLSFYFSMSRFPLSSEPYSVLEQFWEYIILICCSLSDYTLGYLHLTFTGVGKTTGNVNVYFKNSPLHFSVNTCRICLNSSIPKFEIPRWHSGKESTWKFRRHRHVSSIPESGRSPGAGNGYLLQYTCLDNPMDRGTWKATVHVITNSQTHLSTYTHTHAHTHSLKIIRSSFISFCFFLHRCW